MKAYIIVKDGYEYNDEYYYEGEPSEVEKTAFSNKEKATANCDRLNGKHIRENPEVTTEDGVAIIPYKVVEVEVDE